MKQVEYLVEISLVENTQTGKSTWDDDRTKDKKNILLHLVLHLLACFRQALLRDLNRHIQLRLTCSVVTILWLTTRRKWLILIPVHENLTELLYYFISGMVLNFEFALVLNPDYLPNWIVIHEIHLCFIKNYSDKVDDFSQSYQVYRFSVVSLSLLQATMQSVILKSFISCRNQFFKVPLSIRERTCFSHLFQMLPTFCAIW